MFATSSQGCGAGLWGGVTGSGEGGVQHDVG